MQSRRWMRCISSKEKRVIEIQRSALGKVMGGGLLIMLILLLLLLLLLVKGLRG